MEEGIRVGDEVIIHADATESGKLPLSVRVFPPC